MFSTIRKNKRGSLELSINAIVVLVLAITMLGLGIAFTKGKFSELGNKITVPEPDIPATPDDRIVTTGTEMKISAKKDTIFTVNIYNDGDLPSPATLGMACACEKNSDVNPEITDLTIPVGQDGGLKVIVPKTGLNASDSCLCTLSVAGSDGNTVASKQITLNVR